MTRFTAVWIKHHRVIYVDHTGPETVFTVSWPRVWRSQSFLMSGDTETDCRGVKWINNQLAHIHSSVMCQSGWWFISESAAVLQRSLTAENTWIRAIWIWIRKSDHSMRHDKTDVVLTSVFSSVPVNRKVLVCPPMTTSTPRTFLAISRSTVKPEWPRAMILFTPSVCSLFTCSCSEVTSSSNSRWGPEGPHREMFQNLC